MAVTNEPVRITSHDVEMVDLFELDGTMYQVPAEVPASQTIELLDMFADGMSEIQAVSLTVRELLGGNVEGSAWWALRNTAGVPQAQFEQIWKVIERMVMSVAEDTVGKPRPVPRR